MFLCFVLGVGSVLTLIQNCCCCFSLLQMLVLVRLGPSLTLPSFFNENHHQEKLCVLKISIRDLSPALPPSCCCWGKLITWFIYMGRSVPFVSPLWHDPSSLLHLPAFKWNQIFIFFPRKAKSVQTLAFGFWLPQATKGRSVKIAPPDSKLGFFPVPCRISAISTLLPMLRTAEISSSPSQSSRENRSPWLGLRTENTSEHDFSLGWALIHRPFVAAGKLTATKWKHFSVGHSFLLTGILSLWLQVFSFSSLLCLCH